MANVNWSGRVSLLLNDLNGVKRLNGLNVLNAARLPRPHGYYWVKFPTEPQLQIVLIQEDGNVWVFGENQPRRIAGDEPASAKALSFEVVAGPLVPPEIPKLQTPDVHALGRT